MTGKLALTLTAVCSALVLAVVTMLCCLLTWTPLLIAAYIFAITAIFSPVAALAFVFLGNKRDVVSNLGFIYPLDFYIAANVLVSLIFCVPDQLGVWSIPVGWFSLIQLVLLAGTLIKSIMIFVGRGAIQDVERNVEVVRGNWKKLEIQAEVLRSRAAGGNVKMLGELCDAIRYADPMSVAGTQEIEAKISAHLTLLNPAGTPEDVAKIVTEIKNLIQERAMILKLSK